MVLKSSTPIAICFFFALIPNSSFRAAPFPTVYLIFAGITSQIKKDDMIIIGMETEV